MGIVSFTITVTSKGRPYEYLRAFHGKLTVNDPLSGSFTGITTKVKGHLDFGKPGLLAHELLDEYILEKNGLQKFQSLTKREREILALLANGLSNKAVADQLFISKLTVQTHRKVIYAKLDANSVPELTKYAMAFDML